MIYGVLNQKGGVGKTTISVGLAAAFARYGESVLVVDQDPQASATGWQAARVARGAEPLFVVAGKPTATIHKEISLLRRGYDQVIIDGPPRVTELARSAIMASDVIIIPVQPSPYDVWASEGVVSLIREAIIYKPTLKACFVINRKIANTAIGRDVRDALEPYALKVLNAAITQRVVFAEAAAEGRTVYEVDESSQASEEMEAFMNELMEFAHE